jgi:hypothetical protein
VLTARDGSGTVTGDTGAEHNPQHPAQADFRDQDPAMPTNTTPRSAASKAGNSKPLELLVRVGFAASGLIHLLLGYLAIQVALHHGGSPDQSGAFAQIAKLPVGGAILWITVAGMFALALWLLIQAALGIGSSSKKRWTRSLVSAGKAIAYAALGLTALTFARGGSSSSASSTQHASSTLLTLPGGQLLLALIGLATIGIGGYFIAKGVRQRFTQDITVPHGTARRPVIVLGVTGYVAKGIAIAIVGVLFVVAAITLDPKKASGLDGALNSLSSLPFGQILLVAVGIGLIAFGLYTFVRARFAHV